MKLNYFSLNTTLLGLSRLNNNVVKRRNTTVIPPSPSRPEGLIGQYKPYLNSNDSPTRSTLKDYSGLGNDIILYNFGYALQSGYGKWTFDLSRIGWDKLSYSKFRVNQDSKYATSLGTFNTFTLRFKISNFVGTTSGLTIRAIEADKETVLLSTPYTADGIYTFTFSKEDASDFRIFIYNKVPGSTKECSYDVEFLPGYPGALVSDGVDDYGLCENFPILTKEKGYTIVALRKWLNTEDTRGALVSKIPENLQGEFCVEYNYGNSVVIYNFGAELFRPIVDDIFTFQNTKKYNNSAIDIGNATKFDNNLCLFKNRAQGSTYAAIALYALEIYDHDLTDEEIESVKEAMYNEYLTATNALQNHIIADYECYDKTNEDEDRDVLKDLSGNGNDIQLYNFGFAEGSGYGKYAVNFNNFTSYSERGELTKTSSVIHITNVLTNATLIEYQNDIQMPSYKIKVTGLSNSGKTIRYDASKYPSNNYLVIIEDGIYDLPASDISSQFSGGFRVLETGPCNITIEQIPEYKGALVSDGVDDYGNCDNFPNLNKDDGYTIIAIRKILSENDKSRFFITNTLDANAGPNTGAFCFERLTATNNVYLNWGSVNVVKINKELSLTYQTSENYNGTTLNLIGNNTAQPYLRLFSWYGTLDNMSAALYAFKILNKDCTTEEIKFLAKQMVARHKEKTGETITLNI